MSNVHVISFHFKTLSPKYEISFSFLISTCYDKGCKTLYVIKNGIYYCIALWLKLAKNQHNSPDSPESIYKMTPIDQHSWKLKFMAPVCCIFPYRTMKPIPYFGIFFSFSEDWNEFEILYSSTRQHMLDSSSSIWRWIACSIIVRNTVLINIYLMPTK